MDSAFSSAKSALASIPALVHPDPLAKISLAVDALDSHIGAVFQELVPGSWAPFAFFFKKLSSAESCYSAFDRELLAAYSALRHFQFLLEGREFTLFTDHNPLTHSMFRVSPPWAARQQRQLSFLSKFTSNIVHLPCSQNFVADALSWPSLSPPLASSPPLPFSPF